MSGQITAIQAQKRDRSRVNIFIDGRYCFSLTHIVAAWLQIGQVISDEKIADLQHQDEFESAYQKALRFLEVRPRTSEEVRQRLHKSAISEETIKKVVERLQQASLVDDRTYTTIWIENRSDFRPRSRRALSQELRRKGIDPDTIDQALESVDDERLAYQAALKQGRKYINLEWQIFRQKMYGFLGRRGFAYDVSSTVTRRVWVELQEGLPNGTDPESN